MALRGDIVVFFAPVQPDPPEVAPEKEPKNPPRNEPQLKPSNMANQLQLVLFDPPPPTVPEPKRIYYQKPDPPELGKTWQRPPAIYDNQKSYYGVYAELHKEWLKKSG